MTSRRRPVTRRRATRQARREQRVRTVAIALAVVCGAGLAGAGTAAISPAGVGAAVSAAWDDATGTGAAEPGDQTATTSAQDEPQDETRSTLRQDHEEIIRSIGVASRSSRLAPPATVEEWSDRTAVATAPVVGPVVPQLGSAQLPSLVGSLQVSDVAAGLLSLDVPTSASGKLVVVPGTQAAPGPGPVRTVRVEVEAGLEIDPGLFALTVMTTLNDARGWGADGSISFARTDGDADLRVVLASPRLVDRLCAPLDTVGKVSCGTNGHAVLNLLRWVEGAAGWSGDNVAYRQYLVNHEVGHLLGHRHQYCGGTGSLAPLMQQQSGSTGRCLPNPWPFP